MYIASKTDDENAILIKHLVGYVVKLFSKFEQGMYLLYTINPTARLVKTHRKKISGEI